MNIINLPGIGNSGVSHWQTLWEQSGLVQHRFQPDHWDEPELQDWIAALEKAVAACAEPPLLVAHSLSCLLVAHWADRTTQRIGGAMLVAVPDPAANAFPVAAAAFAPVPESVLPFPALMVVSNNDPYSSIHYSRQRASQWQARLVELEGLGHLNADSGLGDWQQGKALLTAFMATACHLIA